MRCSPKFCIALLVIGIGGAAVLASTGNARAASLLSFLPILACPLMCVFMMMFGRNCGDDECRNDHKKEPISVRTHAKK